MAQKRLHSRRIETADRERRERVAQMVLVPTSAQTSLSSPRIWVSATSATAVVLTSGAGVMLIASWMTTTSVGAWAVRGAAGVLPARAVESFTVIGPDLRPVELVDEYLAWLTDCERSPNTVEAYAHDLRAFWTFLAERGLAWDRVGVMELGEFAAWARRPAENVVVLAEESARAVGADGEPDVERGWSASTSFRPAAGRRWRRIWWSRSARAAAAISRSAWDRACPFARAGGAAARAPVAAWHAVA